MIRKKWLQLALSFFTFLVLGSLSSLASAEIIDDITVHADANGDVDAVIKFTVPIQYLRHFPDVRTPYAAIYFNVLSTVPADEWQNYESHRTPPSDVIQNITVSTMDKGTGPQVQIKFYRPAEFSVNMGKNAQTLVIHIKPDKPQQKNESKPATSLAAAAVALPVVATPPAITAATAALPAATAIAKSGAAPVKPVAPRPATPATIKPAASVPVAPVVAAPAGAATPAAPIAAATVGAVGAVTSAAGAIASVAPSGDVTAPKVVLTPSLQKPVHIPLGGTDGLPPFPDVDQQGNAPTAEKSSLAAQIITANNQAGKLMIQAGNEILAGQPVVAIETFNSVLKLPANKYTQDAQLWIGITKEKTGQLEKSILEYNSFLKLYPDGKLANWVKDRIAFLKKSDPAVFAEMAKPAAVPVPLKAKNTEFQYSEFGSLSMSYYHGASQTNTTATVGTLQTPTAFSVTDQKSLMTNVNVTARSYNNEYDNRLVLQDFYAANFLPGQQNNNRLGAAYYELKDRIVNYSVRIGRQSGMGGGVLGRFDGIAAGYGISADYRANIVTGRLSDVTLDNKPTFIGASLDFGVRNPLGGSAYFINQTVSGITDRRAIGGNLRYFEQGFTLMSMLDYDIQFKSLNMLTVQGTLNGLNVAGKGTDFNFLVDRRRSPILDIRNAITGATATSPVLDPITGLLTSTISSPVTVASLQQNGWTISDLILLANQRTTTTNTAQAGMTNHLNEKWIVGTDVSLFNTGGMAASGTMDPATGTTGVEGFVPATPSSGLAWTISERLTGMGLFQPRDVSNFSLSYTKSKLSTSEGFQFGNHSEIRENWALDSNLGAGIQSDTTGGKSKSLSPTVRVTYKVRNNLTLDSQLGLYWTKTSSSALQSSSTSKREFLSFGFQLSF